MSLGSRLCNGWLFFQSRVTVVWKWTPQLHDQSWFCTCILISDTAWTLFSYYPFNSMKRAASLNYLNKTSDDQFQVRDSLCKVFWIVLDWCCMIKNVCILTCVSFHSHIFRICSVFFVRLGEAVISGRAGAWAPAPWISTLETERQAASHQLICSPTQRCSFLWLVLWAATITNNTTRQRGLPHALPPPVSVWPKDPFPPTFPPKDIFSHQHIHNSCVCFFFFPVCF